MLVPLYGFLRGDVVGLLVLVHEDETVAEAARRLREAASVRIAPDERPAAVYAGERRLEPDSTIAEAGLSALDRIDVVVEDAA
jgi:hypothetical protein